MHLLGDFSKKLALLASTAVGKGNTNDSGMEFQTNPYLLWQLLPGLITLGIGLYIQSRPIKKRESKYFSLLMFGGALWAFANAVQLITPDPRWQKFWSTLSYLGIMIVPTAWFLLSIKLTGFIREWVEKIERWLWAVPALMYLSLVTTGFHKLFFSASEIVNVGGYVALENEYALLFFIHRWPRLKRKPVSSKLLWIPGFFPPLCGD